MLRDTGTLPQILDEIKEVLRGMGLHLGMDVGGQAAGQTSKTSAKKFRGFVPKADLTGGVVPARQ